MHIIGTAGHVDHGKSSLVRALTGTDPDRWREEQRRGMTLDLGFARLCFDDGSEAGIIDVPGHERFLHNMLAGAAGMEVVLLVVAANDGAKPQTFEHLAILQYLNVQSTLIVLSKIDTVAPDDQAAAQRRVREALAGTIAATAPLFAVSTHSGAGLTDLRLGIHAALAALPERAADAPVYLPIDRVFALSGHGTIVTGTLMQGRIRVGDSLALVPAARSVRVRSLQVFGQKRDVVNGGTRVAINLPGVETDDVARGAVLTDPQIPTSSRLAVQFRALPGVLEMLKRRTPVRAYIGSAELLATLVFPTTAPADTQPVEAELLLRTPTAVVAGAPFVVRRVSPMDVLGGGSIDAASGQGATRVPTAAAPLTGVEADSPAGAQADPQEQLVLAVLGAKALAGATPVQIGAAANIAVERVEALLTRLVAEKRAVVIAKPLAYVAADLAENLLDRALERLEAHQLQRPWLLGLTSVALAQAVALPELTLVRVLAAYVDAGRLVYRGGFYATRDFVPQLTADQHTFFAAAFADQPGGAPVPVPFEQLRQKMRASNVPDLFAAFETLVGSGALAKVGIDVYAGTHIRAIRLQLETALRASGQLTVAQFRDLTGSSRKYAVPLLEFFDATGVTIRSGDYRVLRASGQKRT